MFLTLGLRAGTAGRVMIANYLQILWSIILEIMFLHSYPHWLSLVGACFILFNAGLAIYKAAKAKSGQNQSGNEGEKDSKKKGKYVKIDASGEEDNIDDEGSGHSGASEDENESGVQMSTFSR